MSEYDDLRRDNYRVDATAKARQQEAYERRHRSAAKPGNTSPDMSATMRRPVQRPVSQQPAAAQPVRSDAAHDRAGRTLIRRNVPQQQPQEPTGGAVVTKRSGIAASMRRNLRERRAARSQQAEQRRTSRRARRQSSYPGEGGGVRAHGCLVLLAMLFAAMVAVYVVVCGPIDRTISFSREEAKGLSSELSWHLPGRPYYVLALGSDAREEDEISRSDTMILIRVDALAGKLTMLSIPRDTKVEIEGYGTQKINAAYAFGGAAGAVRAVSDLCDVPISHVALIKFDGVEELVNYLGGVTVDVPVDVYDPDYTGLVLSAGPQEMDGHTALLFSRVRHGFAIGDYQRQIDQRLLIEAIMNKALSKPPLELPSVVNHMGGIVSTSMRMYSLLPLMLRLKVGGATIYQATVPSTTAMIDGVSYVLADEPALDEMMRVIKAGGDPSTLE